MEGRGGLWARRVRSARRPLSTLLEELLDRDIASQHRLVFLLDEETMRLAAAHDHTRTLLRSFLTRVKVERALATDVNAFKCVVPTAVLKGLFPLSAPVEKLPF